MDLHQCTHWKPVLSLLTCLLLREGDVGVHQASSDAVGTLSSGHLVPEIKTLTFKCVSPDVKANKVSPGKNVVSTKHHSNVGHYDILQESQSHCTCLLSWISSALWEQASVLILTLIQPTMEVVSAELCWVHSMMEYIKTKLDNTFKQN